MSFFEHIKRLGADQSGMTLIDICVVMMVIGILLVPMLDHYEQWKYNKEVGTTTSNRLAINKAIADYYFENGAYPCPALPTLVQGDAAYGNANCGGTAVGGGANVGMVPFATLKIPPEMALDGWTNRMTYGVSTIMTVKATWPANNQGVLRQMGRNPGGGANTCTTTAPFLQSSVVHYFIVSHGPTGVGARTARGVLKQACGAATQDSENCDNDNTFTADLCMATDVAGANFFDDLVDYKSTPPSRIWEYSTADPTDIETGGIEKVGINNPNPQYNLDVIGNIKATTADVNSVCDVNGNNCFPPSMIGGAGISCDGATGTNGMSGIADADARCNTGYSAASELCDTGAGEYVKGIDASGGIICGI